MKSSGILPEGDRREHRDFIIIRIRQHRQTLVRVASEDDFVKPVGIPSGHQGDSIVIALDGIDGSIKVHRRKMMHQGPDICSRTAFHRSPLWTATDGEHSVVLHEIQNKLDRKIKERLTRTTPHGRAKWHQVVIAERFPESMAVEIFRDGTLVVDSGLVLKAHAVELQHVFQHHPHTWRYKVPPIGKQST